MGEKEGRKEPGVLKNFVAGGVGGACIPLILHPLDTAMDTIKVRLQTQPKPALSERPIYARTTINYAYSYKAVRTGVSIDSAYFCKTVGNGGFFMGLYKGYLALRRGILVPLLGITPLFAVCFFGYGVGKRLQQKTPTDVLTLPQHFKAGMLAGVVTTVIMTPGERVKCFMQTQQGSIKQGKFIGCIDCAKQLYREGGICRHIYRGLFLRVRDHHENLE